MGPAWTTYRGSGLSCAGTCDGTQKTINQRALTTQHTHSHVTRRIFLNVCLTKFNHFSFLRSSRWMVSGVRYHVVCAWFHGLAGKGRVENSTGYYKYRRRLTVLAHAHTPMNSGKKHTHIHSLSFAVFSHGITISSRSVASR